ncbi:pyridoxal phosphate-dependent decarboxylase family protein [Flavimaricola marinus]|uniref:L-2,4-diaminobutyrate decarboxylase n=1 Tax=Flavimaricola marinus TaxID=1819565 RepID=A0A238LD71_9RHOB|nr:aminotransferase class V-fold PLP-dependent enzyme [Flavimaricola marinus]SMY07532.1 L-2,4-diaminobutyrate decarboxylase [Flavimaricola marinus]
MTQDTVFPPNPKALDAMLDWANQRIQRGPDPRHGAQSVAALAARLDGAITAKGMDSARAFALFSDVIVPSTRPFDHPTSLAFVASAPSPAALGFDAVLGSAGIFAGNWDGGSGAIYAENQALAWLSSLAGWPATSGGVFVSGGTMGNLSALHAARTAYPGPRPDRWRILASAEAHSSITAAARVMDAEVISVPTDEGGRMDADSARHALSQTSGVFAIVANAGATNCGAIDDLAGLARLAAEQGLWLHVDGAYGLAAMTDPTQRAQFDGIEQADSFTVDPHKWLFAPYDSCALLYRDPAKGRAAHGQRASYLDTLDGQAWNPSDYAIHLTRRARGLPLWFSLVTYGTEAYAKAIRQTRDIAEAIAQGITDTPGLELILGPQLTVLLFRAPGLDDDAIDAWAEAQRRSGALLCLPTRWRGEKVLRICVVNPNTDPDHVLTVLRTLP